MADDLKYGKVSVERGEFLPGEPVFVLRARDLASVDTIRQYAAVAGGFGAPGVHVQGVEVAAQRFEAWQRENRDALKVPD